MSEAIETYVARAKRLGIDPTEVCIACGSTNVHRQIVSGNQFCQRHLDWELATAIICFACSYKVGLTCDDWLRDV